MSLNYKEGSGLQDHKIGRRWQVSCSLYETRLEKQCNNNDNTCTDVVSHTWSKQIGLAEI
jgi:hypothetical protein